MSDEQPELRDRFPNLTPISSAPSLQTVNGIGTTVYGARDHDPETGTYVTTQFFTVLFVPIFGLGSYRVADTGNGGWYFLGREPLSGLVKGWNYLVLLLFCGLVGSFYWSHHTNQPEYIAARRLADGDSLAQNGQLEQAALKYQEVIQNGPRSAEAVERLDGLLQDNGADLQQLAGAYRVAVDIEQSRPTFSQVFDRVSGALK